MRACEARKVVVGGLGYWQAPPMQMPPSGQATQVLPRMPQFSEDAGTQTLVLAQQPKAQFCAHVDMPTQTPF